MLRSTLSRALTDGQKRALRTTLNGARERIARTLLSYDGEQLKARLKKMGVRETDSVMVHANFERDSGFRGTPLDLVNALVDLVGERGNLLMVSIPFRGTAYDHLAANKVFNVKRTVSMMGLVSEMFRRREGTLRSLHPTHPVLAYGKDARWLTEDHDRCLFPCGAGSPFEKFHSLEGKILFFDVGFEAITFFHYVEDVTKDRLPFPVYDERVFVATVVDSDGQTRTMQTYAFNKQVPRRADKLEAEMLRRGVVTKGRIGNSRMLLVSARDVIDCQSGMVQSGNYPYTL